MKNTFESYSDIDRQLEILKIEREISYFRVLQSVQSISNNFTTVKLVKYGIGSLTNSIGSSKEIKILIYSTLFRFLIKKLFRRN